MRWLSLTVRTLMLPWIAVALLFARLGRLLVPPRFQIQGACQNSGRCCRHLLFAEEPFLTWPLLRSVVRFWLERIYPFALSESALMEPDSGIYFRVMTCRNLVDDRCAEYRLRPRVCREWPLPDYDRPPILWRGCGFRVVDLRHPERGDVSKRRDHVKDYVVGEMARRFAEKGVRDDGQGPTR